MELFGSTLGKMIELFIFIFAGYLLTKLRVVKPEAAGVLSKLENTLFIPALVMGTLMGSFTVLRLTSMMGMMNVSFTKEELLKMNKKLNRIKKK